MPQPASQAFLRCALKIAKRMIDVCYIELEIAHGDTVRALPERFVGDQPFALD
jgi:hypothetical protein